MSKVHTVSIKCSLISSGTKFRRIIPEEGPASERPDQVKRVIFCTGKVYYDLAKERKQHNLEGDVAVTRLEQVFSYLSHLICHGFTDICCYNYIPPPSPSPCPPYRSLRSHLTWFEQRLRSTLTLSWSGVRRNTKTWATMIMFARGSSRWWPTRGLCGMALVFVHRKPRVWLRLSQNLSVFSRYVGRDPAAAPATGNKSTHLNELRRFMDTAFNLSRTWSRTCRGDEGCRFT